MKVAVIGAGVSGLSMAQCLKDYAQVKVFEKESTPGGLIRCERVSGNLFHICGGHVFNSKRQDVLDWFWNFFDRENEFTKADRNSAVAMTEGEFLPYPIENHAYLFAPEMMKSFIHDLVVLARSEGEEPANFEEFLRGRFGETLYQVYFKPYNEKVWRRDLKKVPLSWLEGKLPMPTVEEMIYNNMNHVKEKAFVHSSFWYARKDGSQFLANRLAQNLDIEYNSDICRIERVSDGWSVNGCVFDKVVFCGNIKSLPKIIKGVEMGGFISQIDSLESHGTTSVFCEIDKNPYSWVYMPSSAYQSHRIICTGNFSSTNNMDGKMTGTIEFTDKIDKEEIKDNLKRVPFAPKYLAHKYNQYTYPIQDANTREMIAHFKQLMEGQGVYLTGRFADWEYYNMDVAIGASLDSFHKIITE